MRAVTVFAVLALFAPGRAAAQDWTWPDRAENLQVLPADFPAERLRAVMTGFTRALGVRCSHCHVGEEGAPLSSYDFPSDGNPRKAVARTMLDMLGDVNRVLDGIERSGPGRVNMWCHTCHRGRPRPFTLEEELAGAYDEGGIDSVVARYDALRERFYGRGSYDFGERTLNGVGYELLEAGHVEDAIVVFERNASEFPASSNVHDSLGEAWLARGDTARAVASYRKALDLEPRNRNAARALKALDGG
jgi:hypothetical protein